MVRRSVVLERPPEGGRRPVVVRAGPPQRDKRHIADLAVGILGVLLFVYAILLFSLLPQDPPVVPQYEVTFEDTLIEITEVQDHTFAEGETFTFRFPYEDENLYRVSVSVEWTDDIASSRPDAFSLRLLDPDGNEVIDPVRHANPEPEPSDATPPTYEAKTARRTLTADLAPRPSTQVVSASDADEPRELTEARIQEELRRGGAGEWSLEVTLAEAGGCPDPATLDVNRFNDCLVATQGSQEDGGNAFQLVLVSFLRYDPVVAPL